MNKRCLPVLLVALALWPVLAASAAQQPKPAGGPPPAIGEPEEIRMARFRLNRQQVEGRLMHQDEETIRVATPAGGTTTYLKEEIEDLEVFSISRMRWHEKVGDFHQHRAWKLDRPIQELNSARRAYEKALLYAGEPAQEEWLESKLQMVAEDRRQLQEERLRQAEMEEARQKAELVRLQKQLTRQKLEALKEQRAEIARLGRVLQENRRRMELLGHRFEVIGRRLEELEDDVDRLEDFDFGHHFVLHGPFLRLKRDHERLERKVDRLERQAAGD